MKNILIPTDFSIRSLSYVHNIVAQHPGEKLNIIFMHALEMPDSLFDLVTYTRNSRHIELISSDFQDGCEIIRNKYSSAINQLKIEFFHGSTKAALRHFLIAQNIDLIIQPADHDFNAPSKRSYDPEKLLNKCNYPKMRIQMQRRKFITDRSTISALLLAE
ncbi:hypothetical protein DVR12_18010 [Chitinophaga silvatica]|uniref:Universal stress protein n=1 Tax=Chitinophaga silvatica TaxID=2282649 RepID=A0A3E1Y695_9BACT|nr:hypothetical protein [Chitinophaga silvatica]RFS20466.1 hypothetical protein DVR12_18010 [Chitinophaga silvatica]